MKVAIFGGSFDPPHLGHSSVVLQLLERGVDEVLVIPCFEHAEKKNSLPFWRRHALCVQAFGSYPNVTVSIVEQKLQGASSSLRTVQHLQEAHPEWEMSFVLGEDLRESSKLWPGWSDLERIAPPVFFPRSTVSSYLIRAAKEEGRLEDVRRYVTKDVYRLLEAF